MHWYFYQSKGSEYFSNHWISCSKNNTMSIKSVLSTVCSCIPLLCAARCLDYLPLVLTLLSQGALWLLWCCCPVIITLTAAGWQGQVRRKQWFLSMSTELLSGRNTQSGEKYAEREGVHANSSPSWVWQPADVLRGGNHLCLQDNSWTLVKQHCSLKQLSAGYKTGSTSPVVGPAAQALIVSL